MIAPSLPGEATNTRCAAWVLCVALGWACSEPDSSEDDSTGGMDDAAETGATGGGGSKGIDVECNPLLDECADGLGCHSVQLDEPFRCQIAGDGEPGAPCHSSLDCRDGALCLDVVTHCTERSCCVQLCDQLDPECPQGETCHQLGWVGGIQTLGYCHPR